MPTEPSTSTKWLLLGGVLVAVSLFSVVAVVGLSRSGDGTRAVERTTTSDRVDPTTPPTPASVADVDEVEERIETEGGVRTVLVLLPRSDPPEQGFPVVIALHGLGDSASAMAGAGPWRQAVERDEFVAIFPQGVDSSWNLGPCCGLAAARGVQDVDFLGALVDGVSDRPDLDEDRLALTGFSNGALMAYAMVCERPGAFSAIAPMAGANVTGCLPDPPVSLLHQHSDVDPVVPYGGGTALGSILFDQPFPSVPDSVAAWAAADGCDEQVEIIDAPDVERTVWGNCAEGTSVELVMVPGVGHQWLQRGGHDPITAMLSFFGFR